ncbi:MAG TPA: RNA polymerase sigma factor RpoD/SigA [Candidatus Limnocylindrales bacterium]|nr:RNA polymerase sigma factor RpoD/SigA [Candidatus Limnocylindrales bacterium]
MKNPKKHGSAREISTDEGLALYLQEIGKIPPTTREEERELAERIQKGDQEALNRLVEGNLKFVVKVAQGYQGCGLSLMDLINEGNLGLIEAAKRFDPSKNVKFISYAVWWIRQSILRALSEQGRTIRLPLKQGGLLTRLGKVYNDLVQEKGGEEPTPKEIAERMEIPEEQVRVILEFSKKPVSLDMPTAEDENATLMNLIASKESPAPDKALVDQTLIEELQELLNQLDPREALILRLRFGIDGEGPLTLEEIGKRLNLSRERVRQLEKRAKIRLRKLANARSLGDYLN